MFTFNGNLFPHTFNQGTSILVYIVNNVVVSMHTCIYFVKKKIIFSTGFKHKLNGAFEHTHTQDNY